MFHRKVMLFPYLLAAYSAFRVLHQSPVVVRGCFPTLRPVTTNLTVLVQLPAATTVFGVNVTAPVFPTTTTRPPISAGDPCQYRITTENPPPPTVQVGTVNGCPGRSRDCSLQSGQRSQINDITRPLVGQNGIVFGMSCKIGDNSMQLIDPVTGGNFTGGVVPAGDLVIYCIDGRVVLYEGRDGRHWVGTGSKGANAEITCTPQEHCEATVTDSMNVNHTYNPSTGWFSGLNLVPTSQITDPLPVLGCVQGDQMQVTGGDGVIFLAFNFTNRDAHTNDRLRLHCDDGTVQARFTIFNVSLPVTESGPTPVTVDCVPI